MPDDDVQLQREPEVTPEATLEPKPEFVPKADFDKLVGELDGLKTAYGEAGKRLSVIDKVAAMLTGKEESTLSTEEKAVVSELQRLMPHILPNAKALDSLPNIAKTVEAASKAAADGLAQAAYGYQLELQAEAGVPVDNPGLNRLIGVGIRDWLNMDQNRATRFWRGDRAVIQEGFKEVHEMALGPVRRASKQGIMSTVSSRPKNASPGGGGAPSNGEVPTIDFQDKKSVRAAFKTALAS